MGKELTDPLNSYVSQDSGQKLLAAETLSALTNLFEENKVRSKDDTEFILDLRHAQTILEDATDTPVNLQVFT